MLATNFKEGQAIFLPGEDTQVFSVWLQIILQGQVVVDDEENTLDKAQVWSLMVQTYVLATRLGDVQSTNIITDEIVRYVIKSRMSPYMLTLIWHQTSSIPHLQRRRTHRPSRQVHVSAHRCRLKGIFNLACTKSKY